MKNRIIEVKEKDLNEIRENVIALGIFLQKYENENKDLKERIEYSKNDYNRLVDKHTEDLKIKNEWIEDLKEENQKLKDAICKYLAMNEAILSTNNLFIENIEKNINNPKEIKSHLEAFDMFMIHIYEKMIRFSVDIEEEMLHE